MIKIDFKKELETASRGMIMIHDPKLLIKLIVRMLVQKLQLTHAGMVLYDPELDAYVLSISRGECGMRIPAGFTRFNHDSPIVRFFVDSEFRFLLNERGAFQLDDLNRILWHESLMGSPLEYDVKDMFHKVCEQMKTYNVKACVPAYYQRSLMAIMLLGDKTDQTRFDNEELDFFAALASDVAMAIQNAQLFNDLKREAQLNRDLFIQTIIVLSSTIEAKDSYTHGHTERVTKMSLSVARRMVANGSARFDEPFFHNLQVSALLHDIGKIAVPEVILNKTGKLTDEEFEIMKQHTVKGAEMVKPLNLPSDAVDGILHHHERFDGGGYPDGIKGDQITMTAAIIAVADTFDAMTSDRPYRKGLPKEVAIDEIRRQSSKQFHALPAAAIVELFSMGKI